MKQVLLRLSDEQKDWLRVRAAELDTSMTEVMQGLIMGAIKSDELPFSKKRQAGK